LYLFTMLWRVFFGPLKEPAAHEPGHAPVTDLKVREWALLVPLAILCVAIGIYPQPILATTRRDADTLADIAQRARVRAAIAAEGSSQAAADGPSKEATP